VFRFEGWDCICGMGCSDKNGIFLFLARLSERCRIMNLMPSLDSFDGFGRLFVFVVFWILITS